MHDLYNNEYNYFHNFNTWLSLIVFHLHTHRSDKNCTLNPCALNNCMKNENTQYI